jgi:hypothetical protein
MNELEEFYTHNKKAIEYALFQIRTINYTKKYISKKNGSLRELNIPPEFVMRIQKNFNSLLQKLYSPPAPIHGFVENKSGIIKNILTNANQHIKKQVVLNVDIENFFTSINFGRVRGLFLAEPFNTTEKIATKLAQLVINENQLPQGAPTSPTISNLISLKMDHQFIRLAKRYKMVFTRYADDITFSSHRKNINVQEVIEEIEKIVNTNGFSLNPQKTRAQYPFQSQTVTGLKVNQKINVDRKYIRQIRSMLFSWNTLGLDKATLVHFEKFNKQSTKYISEDKTSSYKKIVLGKIHFLGQILGKDNPNFVRFIHTYHLLESNFILEKHLHYEEFDLKNPTIEEILKIFTQIYTSILIFTEGVTDVIYIRKALEFFQSKDKFIDIKLRFCTMNGWADVKKMHEIIYKKDLGNALDDTEKRKFILPLINKNLKSCFVLDADESAILGYFNNQPMNNYFLLDEANHGYIEKMIDKKIIIDFINLHGYDIDPKRASLSKDSKEGLENYLKSSECTDEEIHAPKKTSYIAYKNKIVNKTALADYIKKQKDIDYSKFESLFIFLESMQ